MTRTAMVHRAKEQVTNRFELIHSAAKLARLIHFPTRHRIQDSINRALLKIGRQQDAAAIAGNFGPSQVVELDTQPGLDIDFDIEQGRGVIRQSNLSTDISEAIIRECLPEDMIETINQPKERQGKQ